MNEFEIAQTEVVPPKLVFIHGIGGPRDAAADRDIWINALAEGAICAGHTSFARRLRGDGFDVSFVSYAEMFQEEGRQGGDLALTDAELLQLTELIREVVDRRRTEARVDDEQVQEMLSYISAQLDPPQQQQQEIGRAHV